MKVPAKRGIQIGFMFFVVAAALTFPVSLQARSTHNVTKYDRQHIATWSDGTEVYLETMVARGQYSKELKDVKDWKAWAEETTTLSPSVADAGYWDSTYWYTAGCRITANSGVGRIYFYQLTHDFGYSRWWDTSYSYSPFIAAEGSTDEAWSTWWGWNLMSHSYTNPYVMNWTYPNGVRKPYQEYVVGYYNMGHGVTTPWGSVIVESHAGWVKPVYGPQGNVSCYQA